MDGPSGGEVRVSDDERALAVDHVFQALREGRIDLHELDRRLEQVYAATTWAELAAPLADLPVWVPGTTGESAAVVELESAPDGLTRAGRWMVPRRMRVQQNILGSGLIYLDFTAAEIAYPQVDVELLLGVYGSAVLLVPIGTSADLSRLAGRGRRARTDVPQEPTPNGVHIVISGRTFRRRCVRVRHPRQRRRLRDMLGQR